MEQCPFMCGTKWKPFGVAEPEYSTLEDSPNKYAAVGTAIHQVMEIWGNVKKIGNNQSVEQMIANLDSTFSQIPLALFKDTEDKQKFYDMAVEEIEWLYEQECEMNPLFLEKSFNNLVIYSDLPGFSGTIDRVDGDLDKRVARIVDYKSGKIYVKKEFEDNIQATIYAMAFNKMFGFFPESFTFLFPKVKKKRTIYISPDFLNRGEQRIRRIWDDIKHERFYPTTKNIQYFCKHFCTVSKQCPKNKKKEGWENVGWDLFRPNDNVEA